MNKVPVPVLMIHSVSKPNKRWNNNYLTCPYKLFENQLKWLKNHDYTTISLEELYSYMAKGNKIPTKSIVITFDDGFVDNWVFAYPLLKKYNMKATVYINPEFTEFRDPYYNLNDVYEDKIDISELKTLGYLSWEELTIMEEENIFDVQSHTMTHTWYPCSDKIIDFRYPNDPYIWITWNNNINKKPRLHIDKQNLVDFGQPVYENGRSISVKRYFPNEDFDDCLIEYYSQSELKYSKEQKEILKSFSNKNYIKGHYETEEEYEKRMYYELNESKKIIGKRLNKEVNFLCWPGGAVTDVALNISREVGYLSSTVGKDYLKRENLKNKYGENASRINRIGNVIYWDGNEGKNSVIKYMNGLELILSINYFNKNRFSNFSLAILLGLNKYYSLRSKILNFDF